MELNVDIPEFLHVEPVDIDYPDTPEGRLHYKMMMNAYTRTFLSERQNHRCCWCGDHFNRKIKSKYPTFEHVDTKSSGGADHHDNFAMACHGCNSARGTMDVEEFMQVVAEAKARKTSAKAIVKERFRQRKKKNENMDCSGNNGDASIQPDTTGESALC